MRIALAFLLTLAACATTVDDSAPDNEAPRNGGPVSEGAQVAGGATGGVAGPNGPIGPNGQPLPPAAAGFPKAFDEGLTYTTTRYVAPTGNDGSGNGTNTAPYRTVQRALTGASPGT